MKQSNSAETLHPVDINKSQSLCPLPWMHLSFNSDSSIRACCNTDHGGFIKKEDGSRFYKNELASLDQISNSNFMKKLRLDMINDVKPDFCRTCHRVEENGAPSVRKIFIDQYPKELAQGLKETSADGSLNMKVKYIDFALGNDCNIKCRMCNPGSSYLLKKEFEDLSKNFDIAYTERARNSWEIDDKFKNFLVEIFESTELILTTGGEPFISKKHLSILELAISCGKAKNIRLMYHSNLTLIPDKLVELWKHFKQIDIHGSIEAHNLLNEYIRWPSKWQQIQSNIEKLLSLQKKMPLWLEIHTVFQALNILKLPELFEFLLTFENRIPPLSYLIWLDYPLHLAPAVLPLELRKLAQERTFSFFKKNEKVLLSGRFAEFNEQKIQIAQSHFQRLSLLPFEENNFKDFMQQTLNQDNYRQQNIFEHLPELKSFVLKEFA